MIARHHRELDHKANPRISNPELQGKTRNAEKEKVEAHKEGQKCRKFLQHVVNSDFINRKSESHVLDVSVVFRTDVPVFDHNRNSVQYFVSSSDKLAVRTIEGLLLAP